MRISDDHQNLIEQFASFFNTKSVRGLVTIRNCIYLDNARMIQVFSQMWLNSLVQTLKMLSVLYYT